MPLSVSSKNPGRFIDHDELREEEKKRLKTDKNITITHPMSQNDMRYIGQINRDRDDHIKAEKEVMRIAKEISPDQNRHE